MINYVFIKWEWQIIDIATWWKQNHRLPGLLYKWCYVETIARWHQIQKTELTENTENTKRRVGRVFWNRFSKRIGRKCRPI